MIWFCSRLYGLDFSLKQAIDSFGNRYLLGVFENKDDARKAFDAWNKEYEQVPDRARKFKGRLKCWSCRMSRCLMNYCCWIYIVIMYAVFASSYTKYLPFWWSWFCIYYIEASIHIFNYIYFFLFSCDLTQPNSHSPAWSLINGESNSFHHLPTQMFEHVLRCVYL